MHNENILVCIDSQTNKEKCSLLPGDKFTEISVNDSVMDVSSGQNIHSFKYTVNTGHDENAYGIAVIYPSKQTLTYKVVSKNQSKSMSIFFKEINMNVNLCTGTEGIHVYSPQYKGKEHLYLTLGYDIVQTCSNEVFQ